MVSSPARAGLSAWQRATLEAFFARERGFFLTGGAALVGYHLHHRVTGDLDLFSLDDAAMERGPHVMADVASALAAKLEVRQNAPGFKRYALTGAEGEGVIVDLVREHAHQLHHDKLERDGILVDPPDEILANKLATLVGRTEERDLIDVMFLERAGFVVEAALDTALRKDGGCTPATLAWLLSEVEVPDAVPLPAGVTTLELRQYLDELVRRLRRVAAP